MKWGEVRLRPNPPLWTPSPKEELAACSAGLAPLGQIQGGTGDTRSGNKKQLHLVAVARVSPQPESKWHLVHSWLKRPTRPGFCRGAPTRLRWPAP